MEHLSNAPDQKQKQGKGGYRIVNYSQIFVEVIQQKLLLTEYANQFIASQIEILKKYLIHILINWQTYFKVLFILMSSLNFAITEIQEDFQNHKNDT
ncbi:unnamed protein product [Paramecium octaurelia]|uniref:Uncharacterized protein n=1 Tax=Paramecium octaurelia TaxID=43137 RepID=A0A8S1U5P9_PAROT|nr:unnamed protein product [Paramecium octaurelia]